MQSSQKEVLSLAPACSCKECSHGCSMGSGIFGAGEEKLLEKFLNLSSKELNTSYLEEIEVFGKKFKRPKLLREGKPYGKCIFFKEGKCAIHSVKPLQCKIAMGCKPYGEELQLWFMLNHLLDTGNPESIRQYASYLKAGGKTLPGGQLHELIPDKAMLKRILGYDILR